MTVPVLTGLELLRGDTAVDIEAVKREVRVSFVNPEEKVGYEQQDRRLYANIQLVIAAEIEAAKSQECIAVHEDWFPNKTESLSCDQSVVSAKFVGAVQRLLQGEFANWSVSIEVYRHSNGQQQDIGPIRVYAEKVFAVQALGAQLVGGA